MADFQIVKATFDHIPLLLPHVRQEDIVELAAVGETPESCLKTGLEVSEYAFSVFFNGEIVCIFGVGTASLLGGEGVPWMVGSDRLNRCVPGFLRRSRAAVRILQDRYLLLENWVDARNERAIRWLRWLGFEIHDAAPRGNNGELFHRFTMRGSHV